MSIATSIKRFAIAGLGLAVAACCVLAVQPAVASATPSKAKVAAAYAKYVPAHTGQGQYGGYNVKYADIDGNGVKECLVNSGYAGVQVVYTYKKGKVRKLCGGEVARGGVLYYSTKKHIVTISYAGFAYDGVDVYKIKKGKATKIANAERLHRTNEGYMNGATCPIEQADAVVTKYSKGYKKVKGPSYETTANKHCNGYYTIQAGSTTMKLSKTKATVSGELKYNKKRSISTAISLSSAKHVFKFSSKCKYYVCAADDGRISKSEARGYLKNWSSYYQVYCTFYVKNNVVTKVYFSS